MAAAALRSTSPTFPPELEWLPNPKTRRAYKINVAEFIALPGCAASPSCAPLATPVIAWRNDLKKRELATSSIRRKLSALSALFDYLCEHNAVSGNPVDGVKRPIANGNEGSIPALGECAGAEAAGGGARQHAQGRARSRRPRDPALSWHPPRAAVWFKGARYPEPLGRRTLPQCD